GITHKTREKQPGGVYAKTVKRGLDYLLQKQGKDGDFGGGMYVHSLATMAVCEAYGLTSDPVLKKPAQSAINYLIKAQDPQSGGWRYQPRQGGDTSVTGFVVMALKSGQMAGLAVPNVTLKGAEKWLDSCESPDGSGYGYVGPGDGPGTTAAA